MEVLSTSSMPTRPIPLAPMVLSADSFGSHYRKLSETESQTPARREAAHLFAQAELCLHLGDAPEDATKKARAAVEAARKDGDAEMLTDAVRLVVKANCFRASFGGISATIRRNVLARTEKIVASEASAFQQASIGRGEAAMNLALAEVSLERHSVTARSTALQLAAAARGRFQQLGDRKMEAAAMVVLARAHLSLCNISEGLALVRASLDIFRAMHERFGEAVVLNLLSHALALGGSRVGYEEACGCAVEAAAAYEALGLWRCQVLQQLLLSQLLLRSDCSREAVAEAAEAMRLLRATGCRSLEGQALELLVRAHFEAGDEAAAKRSAEEAKAQFSEAKHCLGEIHAQNALAHALLASNDGDGAFRESMAALEKAESIKDLDAEAVVPHLLVTISQVEVSRQNFEAALEAAKDATAKFEELGGPFCPSVAEGKLAEARVLIRGGMGKEAVQAATSARACFVESGDLMGEARSLVISASLMLVSGDFASATETAIRGQQMCRADSRGEAQALGVLITVARSENDGPKALELARARRGVLQQGGWRRDEAEALDALASILVQSDSLKEAGRASREGLRLARAVGNQELEVHLLCRLTQVYLQLIVQQGGVQSASRNLLEETQRLGRDSVASASAFGEERGKKGKKLLAVALLWASQVQWMSSQEEGLKFATQSIAMHQQAQDADGEATALLLAAQMALANDDRATAESYCTSSLELFQMLGDTAAVTEAELVLERIRPKKLAAVAITTHPDETPISTSSKLALPAKLQPEEVKRKIRTMIMESVSQDDLQDDSNLMESGLDSLASVSLQQELGKTFEVTLPVSALFDYPTIGGLSDYIISLMP